MNNGHYFYVPEDGALVYNTANYYRYAENKNKVGFSLSYGIRNHSNKNIHVRSRGGYSQIIEPSVHSSSLIDRELEGRDVWIDVKFRIGSLQHSNYAKGNHSNAIDAIIAKEIDRRVGPVYHKSLTKEEPYECEFSISLNNIIPNFKSNGYHSETLGITIELDDRDVVHDWLGEIAGNFESVIQNDPKTKFLNIQSSTYQFVYLIDNLGDIGNLWTMQSGAPFRIKGYRNPSVDSGLYIFNNQNCGKSKPYVFIPPDELSDKKLREYGISKTESDTITGARTKEYITLKEELNNRNTTIEKKNIEIKKLNDEVDKLKKDIRDFQEKISYAKIENKEIKSESKIEEERHKLVEKEWVNENKSMNNISGFITLVKNALLLVKAVMTGK